METIDQAIDYIATFDPDFPNQIEGNTNEEIADLERALKRPVSPEHRAFLERMGKSSAWIDLGPVDCSAVTLAGAHEGTEGTLPNELELFGVAEEDPYQDLFLHHAGDPEPRLILLYSLTGGSYANADPAQGIPVAGSIAEMLCVRALVRFRMDPAPHMADFVQRSATPSGWDAFVELARGLKLEPLWFSNSMTHIFEYGSTIVMGRQRPGSPAAFTLAGSDPTEFDLLSRYLVHTLQAERRPSRRAAT